MYTPEILLIILNIMKYFYDYKYGGLPSLTPHPQVIAPQHLATPPPQRLRTEQAAFVIPSISRGSHKINAEIGGILVKVPTQGKYFSSRDLPLRDAPRRFHARTRSAVPSMKVGRGRPLIVLAKQDKASPSTSLHGH